MLHIHHEILCSNINASGGYHAKEKNAGTENQIPHVPTHKWELNNENTWTQGGEHHTSGPVGGRALGDISNVDDGCTKPPWHTYSYVTNLHVLHMYPRT